MICSSSGLELVMTSMSSANASRSPRSLTSSSLAEDLIASSKYTLKRTGESTDPWGSPISASICWLPICIEDCLCSPLMRSIRVLSWSFLHLLSSSFQRISLSTESYAFCKSMRRLYYLFLLPYTSLSKRLAWMAVDLPSLKPV